MRRLITYLILFSVVVVLPAIYVYVTGSDPNPFKDGPGPSPVTSPPQARPDHGDFAHRFQPKPPGPQPSSNNK